MRRFIPLLSAVVLLSLLVLTGCQAGSPEDQVAAKRAQFTVTLNSWYAQVENKAMDEAMDEMTAEGEGAEGEAAESEGGDAEGEAGEEADMEDMDMGFFTGPQPHTIVFDLLVAYGGRGDALSGLTVKVTQADAAGEEKNAWLQTLELPKMTKGVPEQVGFQMEGILFEEGDVFAVTLNKAVPVEERSEYPEFQSAGS